MDDIGASVKLLRIQVGLTQKVLGRRAGVSQNVISKIEHGVANPRLTTLVKVAHALNVSVPDLLSKKLRYGEKSDWFSDDFLSVFKENFERSIPKYRTRLALYDEALLSNATISRVFREKVDPTIDTLLKIASITGISLGELFRRRNA